MERQDRDPRFKALRALVEKTLGEMDLDGIVPVDERELFADCIAETLLRSPLLADMSKEGADHV
jgi:hypothetical protein